MRRMHDDKEVVSKVYVDDETLVVETADGHSEEFEIQGGGGELTPEALVEVLEGSETVVVDINEAGDKVQVKLDQDVVDEIDSKQDQLTAGSDINIEDDEISTIYGGSINPAELVGTYSGIVFSGGRMEIFDSQLPTTMAQKTLLPGYFNPNIIYDVRVHFDGVEDDLIINAETAYFHNCNSDINQGVVQNFYYAASSHDDLGSYNIQMEANAGGYNFLYLRAEDFTTAHSIEDGTPFTITINDFDWKTPISASFMPVNNSTFKIESGIIDLPIYGNNGSGLSVNKNYGGGYVVQNNLDLGTLHVIEDSKLSTIIGGGLSGLLLNDTLTYVGEYSGEDHSQYEYDINASDEEFKNIFNSNNWYNYSGESFNNITMIIKSDDGAIWSQQAVDYTRTETANGYIDKFTCWDIELTNTVEDGESTYSAKFYYYDNELADDMKLSVSSMLDRDKYIAYTAPIGAQYVPIDNDTIIINDDGKLEAAGGGAEYTFTNGLTEADGIVSWDLNNIVRYDNNKTSLSIGSGTTDPSSDYNFIAIGKNAKSGQQGLSIGFGAQSTKAFSINIGKTSGNCINILKGNNHYDFALGSLATDKVLSAIDYDGTYFNTAALYIGCNNFTTDASGNKNSATCGGKRVITTDQVPDAPTADGNYVLKCTVADGVATYTWIAE